MKSKYKKPLTVAEQVDYLEQHKRVVYNDITKQKAQEFLYTHNYINVISPYKVNFAKKDENDKVIKDAQGNHIYERDIDFSEYQLMYDKEREEYPKLYTAILNFETKLNAIVSNEAAIYYDLNSDLSFKNFENSLVSNIDSSQDSSNSKKFMIKTVNKFSEYLNTYGSIFILLDRLSLGEVVTLFKSCDKKLKIKIFNELLSRNLTFGYVKLYDFEQALVKIIWIRNTIMHGNSLSILFRYFNVKNKDIRSREDSEALKNLKEKILNYYKLL